MIEADEPGWHVKPSWAKLSRRRMHAMPMGFAGTLRSLHLSIWATRILIIFGSNWSFMFYSETPWILQNINDVLVLYYCTF